MGLRLRKCLHWPFEKEGWRKKRSYQFDANGELHSLCRERNDGSFREQWERDETSAPRTKGMCCKVFGSEAHGIGLRCSPES